MSVGRLGSKISDDGDAGSELFWGCHGSGGGALLLHGRVLWKSKMVEEQTLHLHIMPLSAWGTSLRQR